MQEPRDGRHPQTADQVVVEHHHDAHSEQPISNELAHERGPLCGLADTAGGAPQDRAQDPATVERIARHEVEEAEHDVDVEEIAGNDRHARLVHGGSDGEADGRHGEAGQRADYCDQELGRG